MAQVVQYQSCGEISGKHSCCAMARSVGATVCSLRKPLATKLVSNGLGIY